MKALHFIAILVLAAVASAAPQGLGKRNVPDSPLNFRDNGSYPCPPWLQNPTLPPNICNYLPSDVDSSLPSRGARNLRGTFP